MEFLRNTWYAALWAQDLAPGQLVPRIFLNEPVVLFRQADGTPAAIADVCAHRFNPLSKGKAAHGNPSRLKSGMNAISAGRTPYPLKPVLFDIDIGLARYKRILEAMIHREAREGHKAA